MAAVNDTPLVVIVGPTASGKTGLAVEVAEQVGGEIICADSRTVYKDMDIGTAKPGPEDRQRVVHWGLDLVAPGERFSAADFRTYAESKIAEIRTRGHIPFLVGGSGLYVDAVLFDYQFGSPADHKQREELEKLSLIELWKHCDENHITLPENRLNKRYIIRAIQQRCINSKRRTAPIDPTIIVGIITEKEVLHERIRVRIEQLIVAGVAEEARMLGEKYGWESEAMTGNAYPLLKHYLDGEISIEETKERIEIADRQLAKRQLTWLKRNKFIHWLSLEEARAYLIDRLAHR